MKRFSFLSLLLCAKFSFAHEHSDAGSTSISMATLAVEPPVLISKIDVAYPPQAIEKHLEPHVHLEIAVERPGADEVAIAQRLDLEARLHRLDAGHTRDRAD